MDLTISLTKVAVAHKKKEADEKVNNLKPNLKGILIDNTLILYSVIISHKQWHI